MASIRLDFDGPRGKLAGKLELPDGTLHGYALLAHCFTCGKDFKATKQLARALAELGWATLRFDVTGIGESEGDFAATGFATIVADIVAAAEALRRGWAAPCLLIGHSLGGAAVIAAAPSIPEARAIATIATPAQPAHVLHLIEPALPGIERDGEATIALGGRDFTFRRDFVDEIRGISLESTLAGLDRALIVLHSPTDDTVGIENARTLYEMARHPKSFVGLEGADHLLTRRIDSDHAAGMIAAWARRYVPRPPLREMDKDDPPAGTVIVEETRAGRFHQAVRVGRHRLVADEPVSFGGEDAGPGPYDYLLAGLGACTSMTLRLYAERKNWPLERVEVDLLHRKIHAEDCRDCEPGDKRLDEITRKITLHGPLDAEQRARLMEIADKCPVHRTLEAGVRVRTVEGGR